MLGPAARAVADADVDVGAPEPRQTPLSLKRQLLDHFDAPYPTRQPRQDRSLVAEAGADLEHAVCRLRGEEVGHHRHDERLRDRLVEADRQRRVVVGQGGQRRRHEAVAWDMRHGAQHPRIEHRLAEFFLGQLGVDRDDLDHVPAQDREVRLAHLSHDEASLTRASAGLRTP